MTASRTQQIVARCLAEPGYLSSLKLSDAPLDLDLATLRLVGGFIVMVRHTPLRRVLPRTLALLSTLGVGLDVFANYFDRFEAMRRQGGLTEDQRLAAFLDLLEENAASGSLPARLARDLAVHERILWDLRRAVENAVLPAVCPPPCPDTPICPESVPAIRGIFQVGSFSRDPRATFEDLGIGVSAADLSVERDLHLGYWLEGRSNEVHYFSLEPTEVLILSLVDGHRNLAAIAATLRGLGLPVINYRLVLDPFAALASCGLIYWADLAS